MSQQVPPQQVAQPYQAQTPVGQQLQQQPLAQAVGQRFTQSVSPEVQAAVSDLGRLETVCEWLKGRATEKSRPRLAQRADDIANIAHLQKKLLLRNSPFAEPIGQAVQQTIQQGVQEFQRRASDPEVQDAIAQAQQTINNVSQALSRIQQVGQQSMGPQPAPPASQAPQPAPQASQAPPASQPVPEMQSQIPPTSFGQQPY
jgi:hypothetical protein